MMWWASGWTAKSDTRPELIAGPIERSSRPEKVFADMPLSLSVSASSFAALAATGNVNSEITSASTNSFFIEFPSLSKKRETRLSAFSSMR